MCGIAGIWWNKLEQRKEGFIKVMTDAIAHRGPDAEGQIQLSNGLDLGHRRLAILDLDPRSNQPFHWLERYTLTFNGEIYNYLELQQELRIKGYFFQTQSDTEVICAAYNEWGTDCLKHFDGMFAFALYDSRSETLFCARDRFGEKPFYYALHNGTFSFASEMKALWSIGVPTTVRPGMMHLFLRDSINEDVTTPSRTFYEDIYQLKPSHYFVLDKEFKVNQICYYKPSIITTFTGTFKDAYHQFSQLLNQSIERRMRADVKLGSSLSGGIDSSSIVAKMADRNTTVNTFSARFKNFDKDEGVFIEKVTNSCHSVHHDVFVKGEDLINQIDKLLFHHEEPFQSSSINAQFAVYECARQEGNLVMLDGQGADEYLAGYFKFLIPYYYSLPFYKRSAFKNQLKDNQGIDLNLTLQHYLQFQLPKLYNGLSQSFKKIRSKRASDIGDALRAQNLTSNPFIVFANLKETLLYNLTVQGLPKLLKFADRNSMANSIEVRLPFLSHELVDFVLSLPDEFFFKGGWTKSILRNSMNDFLPTDIVWRKDKVGFEAPHDTWLELVEYKTELDHARSFLIEKKLIEPTYKNNWNILILYRLLITHEKESFNHSI